MKSGLSYGVEYIRGFSLGLTHGLAFSNLYLGENSLGDKIMSLIMPKLGPVDNPFSFSIGLTSSFIFESALLIDSAYELFEGNPEYFLANLGVKTIPRGLEMIVNFAKGY